jgi:hypothetical protein
MKRSAAKTSRRRKPLTFYVDECLGRFVADALAADGFDVRPYYEHFAGRRDIEWLPEVGELRWIVLTKDKNIRRRQLEVDAILNAGVRAFVVTAVGLHREALARLVLRAMSKIHRISSCGGHSSSTSRQAAWCHKYRTEPCAVGLVRRVRHEGIYTAPAGHILQTDSRRPW